MGVVGFVGTFFGGEQFLEVAGQVKPGALETDACKEVLPDGIFATQTEERFLVARKVAIDKDRESGQKLGSEVSRNCKCLRHRVVLVIAIVDIVT